MEDKRLQRQLLTDLYRAKLEKAAQKKTEFALARAAQQSRARERRQKRGA